MMITIYDVFMMITIYDVFMMITIIFSLIPLTVKDDNSFLIWIDRVTVVIFIIDYLLRFLTADIKLKKGKSSFIRYPFTFMAFVDLIAILPSLIVVNKGLRLLKIFRLIRTFKVFRVFKAFRYSKNVEIIVNVFIKQKESLITVGILALGYIFV